MAGDGTWYVEYGLYFGSSGLVSKMVFLTARARPSILLAMGGLGLLTSLGPGKCRMQGQTALVCHISPRSRQVPHCAALAALAALTAEVAASSAKMSLDAQRMPAILTAAQHPLHCCRSLQARQ